MDSAECLQLLRGPNSRGGGKLMYTSTFSVRKSKSYRFAFRWTFSLSFFIAQVSLFFVFLILHFLKFSCEKFGVITYIYIYFDRFAAMTIIYIYTLVKICKRNLSPLLDLELVNTDIYSQAVGGYFFGINLKLLVLGNYLSNLVQNDSVIGEDIQKDGRTRRPLMYFLFTNMQKRIKTTVSPVRSL